MSAEYFAPTGLEEARALMQSRDLTIVAGGTDYYPALGQRPLTRDVMDVTRLAALKGLTWLDDGTLRIGATTTWTEVVQADLPPAFAGLQAAGREVGSVQIQNAATVAGNICNASPAADGVPPLLTLDSSVEINGPEGERHVPLAAFLTGPRQTVLGPQDFVTALHVPPVEAATRSAFGKLGARKYLVISIAMCAALVRVRADGTLAWARVAVGACSPVAVRLPALEAALVGQDVRAPQIAPEHLAPLDPISDIRADAAYRRDAVRTLIAQTVQEAGRAHG